MKKSLGRAMPPVDAEDSALAAYQRAYAGAKAQRISTAIARRCSVSHSGIETLVTVESAANPYCWRFTHRLFQQGDFWTAGRCWTNGGKVYYREYFLEDGRGSPNGWNTPAAMLIDLEPWLTLEFGNVLEAAFAAPPLRDILVWAGQHGAGARWVGHTEASSSEWPLELGQDFYVH